jgi:hypothetical protein
MNARTSVCPQIRFVATDNALNVYDPFMKLKEGVAEQLKHSPEISSKT